MSGTPDGLVGQQPSQEGEIARAVSGARGAAGWRMTHDYDYDVEKFERLIRDNKARRDLLWLRAQEKEDHESIGLLEEVDPGLRARMEALMRKTRPDLIEERRARSAAFAELYHRHYDSL